MESINPKAGRRIQERFMSIHSIQIALLIIGITLLSGFADAQGFLHASKIWNSGKLVWNELGKSALGFGIGIGTYWIVIKYLQEFKIVTPEIQTILWFSVAIIGVAVASGKFIQWPLIDQIVGVGVLLGIGWILIRTGS